MASNYKRIGNYIRQVDVRNTDARLGEEDLYGLSVYKEFIPTHANLVGVKFNGYKIVAPGQFTYIPDTSRRGDKIAIGLNGFGKDIIVSSVYTVFEIYKPDELNAEYLMMLFRNPEYDRFARYNSWGSAREVFSWEDFCDSELYIPDIEEQKKIVKQYNTITERIRLLNSINENLYKLCMTGYKDLIKGLTVEDDMPDGWKVAPLGDYADVKSGYAFKSAWWQAEGVPVIKIANIVNNTIILDGSDCVSETNGKRAKDFWVSSGDLLIAMTGATTGKIGIVPTMENKVLVNQRVGKFFLGETPVKKIAFLFCSLLSDDVSKQTHPDGDAGSAQDNLSPDDIKDIKLVYPPRKQIDDFNKMYGEVLNCTMQINSEIIKLQHLAEHLVSKI